MNVDECFKKGILIREKPDSEKSKKSLEIAKHKCELAQRLFELKIFEETVLNSYSSMFHAARALLFKDGVREKSHYAVFVYLKENYSAKLERKFINELNALRLERHEISYGLEKHTIEESDAEKIVEIAQQFVLAVERLIKNENKNS